MKVPSTAGVVTLLALFSLMVVGPQPAPAQTQGGGPVVIEQRSPVVNQAVHHDVSPPLYLIPPAPRQAGPRVHPVRPVPRGINSGAADPVVQQSVPTILPPAPALNFDGVGNGFSGPSGTFTVQGAPPDTNGDVGPNHYVQIVNTDFAVFNKSGTAIYGPVPINTLWSGFGGLCQTDNDGDPVVVYDPIVDRWVISQFAVSGADGVVVPFLECVAVSQTPDPTGTYNRYSFAYPSFNDYPKMGVWPDAYYTTFNFFDAALNFLGGEVCAYDRASMLAGAAATQQCFNVGTSFGGLLPADLDGARQPPAGSPNYVLALGAVADLAFWKFHIDWTTPANTTLTGPTTITTAAYTLACNGGGTCIPQTGTSQQLDSLGDRLMFRLAYRNFGDHEALVANHSVTAGSSVGVRWYEILSPGTTPSIFQQGTYAPDSNYRWMGSIAMDQNGNMALGFSVSGSAIHPEIHYTGRLAGDPAGQMTQGEGALIDGAGSQSGSFGLTRWGDYSMMGIDPSDDCTFWYTNEYIPSTGEFNWSTRIGSFKFPSCTVSTVTLSPNGILFNNQLVNTTSTTSNVQLTNSGAATLNITSITLAGTDPSQFTLVAPTSGSPTCSFGPSTINANSSCFLGVQFKPTTAGAHSANVSVADDASGSPQLVSLTGIGIAPAPALTLLPTSVVFGTVNVGGTAPTSNVQLTNSGTATLHITSITLTGTDPSQFALVAPTSGSPTCSFGPSTINANSSCFLGVQFKPTTAGARSANVSVTDDAPGSPQLVSLTGIGIAPAPALTLLPTSVAFGTVNVGGTAAASNDVELTSSGTATLHITSIMLTGTDASQFVLAPTSSSPPCLFGASTMKVGNSCFLGVQFKPTTAGARSANVSVTDDAPGSPQLVSLTGIGIAPAVTLSATSVAFASVNVGGTAPTSNVQLTNSGTAPLNISSILLTGTDASQFALVAPTSSSPACSFGASIINAGGSCFLGVQFKPTTAGAHNANVSVADNASDSPQTVALTGIGTDFTIGPAMGGSTSATVTAGQTATYNLQVSALSGFNGAVTFSNCSGTPSEAACTTSLASVLVNGTAAAFTVTVTTTAPSMIAPRTGPPNWPPLTGLRLTFLLLFALALLAILRRFGDAAKLPRPGLALAPALALVLLILAWVGGCGGGGPSALRNPGTPKGTSTFTLTATSGTATSGFLSHTQNLTLTVN